MKLEYEIKGKKAIVCGASSGIGFGASLKLASEGSNVLLVSRNEEHLKHAVNRIKDKTGSDASFLACDISKASEIDRLAA
ncbi:oxidoreductase, short chain dehydrogenase/reductase family protein, partial [mine drainage metagenome]